MPQNTMINASLTFHQPETIYHFLQKNVGPFFMVIKNGQAIINFLKPDHAKIALSQYHNTMLGGMPLKLTLFREQDLNKPEQSEKIVPENNIQAPVVPPTPVEVKDVKEPAPKLSEFTILMQESLKINDPENIFQSMTKKNRKQIIEYVNSYAPLVQTAQLKRQQIIDRYNNPVEKDKKVQEFATYYKNGLTNLTQNIKKQFKNLRRCCSKYGQPQENIDVEPDIQINPIPKSHMEKITSYKNKLQYITADGFQIKRIAALNDKQFVCSLNNRYTGNLSFYKADDQYAEMNLQIKEGAYGLLLLENYILVGTNQGNISFVNTADLSNREISIRLHNGLIYELVNFGKRHQSYNIISLSGDNSLKLWNVGEYSYTNQAHTLFFEQSFALKDDYAKINSVDVIDSSKIAYAKMKTLHLYDFQSQKHIASQNTKGMILKVAKLDEQYIAAVNERYLSFVDIRNNAKTLNYDIAKEVKTLAALNQYSVFYGCSDGEVGLVDRRVDSKSFWKTNTVHKSKIYDVCRMGDMVLTGDNVGQLASWVPLDVASRSGMVEQYK